MTEDASIKDLFGNDDQEAMYQEALRVPLADKIQMAIGLIQLYEPSALRLSEDGFYVCFSGGKDSIVMARLFEMAGVKYNLNYSNVTIDPPELVRFIKREYPQTIWHNPKKHILRHMVDNCQGLPTRIMRWCCSIYKEQGGNGLFKVLGVRAAESARRKGLWQPIRTIPGQKAPVMSPILYWTDEDVWQFIRGNEMPYCSLYDEGYHRLGCVGCPMSGQRAEKGILPDGRNTKQCGKKLHKIGSTNGARSHGETESQEVTRNTKLLRNIGHGGWKIRTSTTQTSQTARCIYGETIDNISRVQSCSKVC